MYENFMIYSPTSDAGKQFWSARHGWTNLFCADSFPALEKDAFCLSFIGAADAQIIPSAHAYNLSLRHLEDEYPPTDLSGSIYDSVFINGVREENDECRVDDYNPHFFSVYLHKTEGCSECVGDFGTYAKARAYAQRLLEDFNLVLCDCIPERLSHF